MTELVTLFMEAACKAGSDECDGLCEKCVFDNEDVFKGWLLGELMNEKMWK